MNANSSELHKTSIQFQLDWKFKFSAQYEFLPVVGLVSSLEWHSRQNECDTNTPKHPKIERNVLRLVLDS